MNERILELRTQVAAWVAKNHQPQDSNAYSQKEIDQRYLMYEEKFAELIVRECCDWIDGSPATDAGQLLLTKSFIIANLKGHFGVEL